MPDIWMDVDVNLSQVPVNIFPLTDDTDFKTRETGVAYDAAGMDLVWNFVGPAGDFAQTAVTPTSGGSYDWAHRGDGMYSIEMPATGGASINNNTEGVGWFTGVATGILPWRGPTIGFRRAALNDLLMEGGTASSNLEDFFDGTGYEGGGIPLNVDFIDDPNATALTAIVDAMLAQALAAYTTADTVGDRLRQIGDPTVEESGLSDAATATLVSKINALAALISRMFSLGIHGWDTATITPAYSVVVPVGWTITITGSNYIMTQNQTSGAATVLGTITSAGWVADVGWSGVIAFESLRIVVDGTGEAVPFPAGVLSFSGTIRGAERTIEVPLQAKEVDATGTVIHVGPSGAVSFYNMIPDASGFGSGPGFTAVQPIRTRRYGISGITYNEDGTMNVMTREDGSTVTFGYTDGVMTSIVESES